MDLLSVWGDLSDEDRTLAKSLVEPRTSLGGQLTVGKKLKWLRRQAKFTQRQLAAKTGVPYATVRDIEQSVIGKPAIADMVRLSRAVGKSVATFENCTGVAVGRPKGK